MLHRWLLEIALVPIGLLRPHEMIDESNLRRVLSAILAEGAVRRPLLVDARTLTVLDGHHRLESLRMLGARLAPALLVDYMDDQLVRVVGWRTGEPMDKAVIIRRALEGRPYPPKTTRHILSLPVPEAPVRLEILGVRAWRSSAPRTWDCS